MEWRRDFAKIVALLGAVILLSLNIGTSLADEQSFDFNRVPVKGDVTMIDLGARKCIPCKMMAPIMEKLEKVYKGKAVVAFIDVWENPKQATRFGVRTIPTQIFFDREGKEVYRHVGFMSEAEIVGQLQKMGVK